MHIKIFAIRICIITITHICPLTRNQGTYHTEALHNAFITVKVRIECVSIWSTQIILCVCVCVCVCSVMSDSVAQAPLSMEFSWQGFWSGLSFPTPREFHEPGIKPVSLASLALKGQLKNCLSMHLGSPQIILVSTLFTPKK